MRSSPAAARSTPMYSSITAAQSRPIAGGHSFHRYFYQQRRDLDAINFTTAVSVRHDVNNGTITATNGIVQFFSTLENDGGLEHQFPPVAATNNWVGNTDGNGDGRELVKESAPSLTDLADVYLTSMPAARCHQSMPRPRGAFPGSLVISNLTVAASAPDSNTLLSERLPAQTRHCLSCNNWSSTPTVSSWLMTLQS